MRLVWLLELAALDVSLTVNARAIQRDRNHVGIIMCVAFASGGICPLTGYCCVTAQVVLLQRGRVRTV